MTQGLAGGVTGMLKIDELSDFLLNKILRLHTLFVVHGGTVRGSYRILLPIRRCNSVSIG
jgi:hypothetical protein